MSRTQIIFLVIGVVVVIGLVVAWKYFSNSSDTMTLTDEEIPPVSTTRIRPLTILKAEYGCDLSDCKKMDVTSKLKSLIFDDALVIPAATDGLHFNRLFGRDPAPNIPKTLVIDYTIGTDGESLQEIIADSSGVKINI